MLEYFHCASLISLPEELLVPYLGTSRPHEYLLLLRTATLLQYCPTFIACNYSNIPWCPYPDIRRSLGRELGLPETATMRKVLQVLREYLDTPWPRYPIIYRYQGKHYFISNVPNARELWKVLARYNAFIVIDVDPHTLLVECRARFSF